MDELIADLTFSDRATVHRVRRPDGTTAIVKRHKEPASRANEVRALSSFPSGTAPALIEHDDERIVMEDLGDGPSLADLLLGDDGTAALRGLLAWATTLGRIAAATTGTRPEASERMPAWYDPARVDGLAGALGTSVPDAVVEELRRPPAANDDRFVSLTPLDVCPDNNRVTPEGVRLFDFEWTADVHAGTAASYLLVPFCSCWCAAALPDGVIDEMRSAYVDAFPAAADPAFWRTAERLGTIAVCGTLSFFASGSEERLPNWPLTPRQYVAHRLAWLAGRTEHLPETAAFAADLLVRLGEHEPPRLYPAFAGAGT